MTKYHCAFYMTADAVCSLTDCSDTFLNFWLTRV